MIYICHRGNQKGPNPEKENHPDYLMQAVKNGFEVEVDVWLQNDKFYLGHDGPQYQVKEDFLLNQKFWHHCKNMEALFHLNTISKRTPDFINCFFHDSDDCTLTSNGWIWVYPKDLPLNYKSIAVMPERVSGWNFYKCGGVCTDYPIDLMGYLSK